MERKLAAIMAGDIVGYSRLMAKDEAGTYADLRSVLDDLITPTIERHGGRTFQDDGRWVPGDIPERERGA